MEIPFEIWLSISRFIPSNELQGLYGVNHAFFTIAMTERYKVTDFDYRQEIFQNAETSGYILNFVLSLRNNKLFVTERTHLSCNASALSGYGPKSFQRLLKDGTPLRTGDTEMLLSGL